MSFSFSKSIFISYVDADRPVAESLAYTLKDLLGEDAWLRDFDLNGGDLVAEAISEAIADAKWFVLLLSAASIKSNWIINEANLATIRSIEDLGFKIIVLALDESKLPGHLEIALKSQMSLHLAGIRDLQNEFIRVAEYIYQHSSSGSSSEVYVDRGIDTDGFSLLARRNRIIFILGWAGIGKTSFVLHSVSEKLKKFPIKLILTRGHSIDYLARQILYKCHVKQPLAGVEADESRLLSMALQAVRDRSRTHFLVLDNAEWGLGSSNEFLPYLLSFLELFIKSDIDTHLILTTTRSPELTPSIVKSADVLPLYGLDDSYITETIDQLLEGTPRYNETMRSQGLPELVKLISGHPLAAKMLASSLKTKTPEQMLSTKEKHRFELMFAEHILRSSDQSVLDDLDRLILQILATVREPMLLQDMLSVKELSQYPLEAIHGARTKLSSLFLVEQIGEMMYLHNFLAAYYQDQLQHQEDRRDKIANNFGLYAHAKAISLNEKLSRYNKEGQFLDTGPYLDTSNAVFRYAISANRLLRSVGKDHLADELPIQVRGTVRELVFYFYQEKKDYSKARDYAERWLKFVPTDSEVLLYLVRCYRNLRDPVSLSKAEGLLNQINQSNINSRFMARIYREKALIADFRGDSREAKEYFRQGINIERRNPYPENFVGLAQLLLREAEENSYNEKRKQDITEEAVKLLETARRHLATFDRYHLGLYLEALIEAGDYDKALPLLEDALGENPEDARLNYRMAEILRKQDGYDQAEEFARIAWKNGAPKAPISLANILHSQAVALLDAGMNVKATDKLEEALRVLSQFRPEFGSDQEIADSIKAKIYRTLGDWEKAHKAVESYTTTENPYTVYEQSLADMSASTSYTAKAQYENALQAVEQSIQRIRSLGSKRELSRPLEELLENAERQRQTLESILQS